MRTLRLAGLSVVLLIQACAGRVSTPEPGAPVAEQGGTTVLAPATGGSPDESPPPVPEHQSRVTIDKGSMGGGPAVTALLDAADQAAKAGRVDLAAAAIERALRLEPQNALLWSRLASIRLRQRDWAQAETLAGKSSSLARDNAGLRLQNWRIIEQARLEQGDRAGAGEARDMIEKLRIRD
jgi:hypothetical protein